MISLYWFISRNYSTYFVHDMDKKKSFLLERKFHFSDSHTNNKNKGENCWLFFTLDNYFKESVRFQSLGNYQLLINCRFIY